MNKPTSPLLFANRFSKTCPPETKRSFKFILLNSLLLLILSTGCAISPVPFTPEELNQKAKDDLHEIFAQQEPLNQEISLYDAMTRAIKYNLNHKVKLMENAMAKGALVQAQKDLLPQLVTSAGYNTRNNYNASFSKNLTTGTTTTTADLSISEEKHNFTSDLIFVWNILDFGVGYQQAKQQADQVLIAEEQRRKAAQNIAQEIRYAFWRAVSAEKIIPKMDRLVKEVEFALQRSRQMEKAQADKPLKVLDYQQELLETVQQLWNMRRNLALAKTELANLMNVKPGIKFTLKTAKERSLEYPDFSLELLEKYALMQRPELRTEAYQERIGSHEIKKAMLRMLPGIELSTGANYESNSYLYNNSWMHAGLSLSWNAFNLLSSKTAISNATLQRDLAKQRHMAASMMVLSQVNISKQQFHLSLKEYQIVAQLDEVHQRKLWHTDAAKKTKTGNELEEIRNKVNALSAEMQLGITFSELQGAIGNIYNSIGYDPLPKTISSNADRGLASIMESHDQKVLTYFASSTKTTYSVPNPFAFKQLNNGNKTFILGPEEEAQPIQETGSAQKYSESPSPLYQNRKIYKRKQTEQPRAPETPPAEQTLVNLQQPVPIDQIRPSSHEIRLKGENRNQKNFFPASQNVQVLLKDLAASKSKQLKALAKQLSDTPANNRFPQVVTMNGSNYELTMTPQGKVLEGTKINPYSIDQAYWTGQNKTNNTGTENPTYIMHRNLTVGPYGILDNENIR